MKNPIIQFILCAFIGLGLGYVVFDVVIADGGNNKEVASSAETAKNSTEATKEEQKATKTEATATASGEENILQSKGCIGCHAVKGLNLDGGATGPDLSQAYNNVEGKHGKPIQEFLKEPTSAVMSSVIGGNPLTDDEIAQIVEQLKKASEAK